MFEYPLWADSGKNSNFFGLSNQQHCLNCIQIYDQRRPIKQRSQGIRFKKHNAKLALNLQTGYLCHWKQQTSSETCQHISFAQRSHHQDLKSDQQYPDQPSWLLPSSSGLWRNSSHERGHQWCKSHRCTRKRFFLYKWIQINMWFEEISLFQERKRCQRKLNWKVRPWNLRRLHLIHHENNQHCHKDNSWQ